MSGGLKIYLKPNERIFINGAVLRVDRKVSIALMNDVVFLLETHLLQEEQATTPLRQLYFIVQSMLIEPKTTELSRQLFDPFYKSLLETFRDRDVLEALVEIKGLVTSNRPFEALKRLRGLYPIEQRILNGGAAEVVATKAVA